MLAKAPLPGWAKTRLAPAVGAAGAARLQRQLTLATLRTACAARLGPVTLWCAPDCTHRFFRALRRHSALDCRAQVDGDIGARMHAAFVAHAGVGPLLLVGTDCPALRPSHLHQAAQALGDGADAVVVPAEDGGYVLIGLRQPQPALFAGVRWSTADVMRDTRERAHSAGLRLVELDTLWDLDVPADLARWTQRGPTMR